MSTIILQEDEFIHVSNLENGDLFLVEGPNRFELPSNCSLVGNCKRRRIILKDDEYCSILNPFDRETEKYRYGEREIRVGPLTFALYPEEQMGARESVQILNKDQYLVMLSNADTEEHRAGEKWIVRGPARYIPSKHESILKKGDNISLGQNQAIYLRKIATGELTMVEGPCTYVVGVDEELYSKILSTEEYEALRLSHEPSYEAFSVNIQKNELVCVVNDLDNTEEYILGPDTRLLGPMEHFKVAVLSGDVPKREGVIKAVKMRLGPDFCLDSFPIRTRDNALLHLSLMYKWRFVIPGNRKEEMSKIFEHDSIGYACQSLRSRIRETASSYFFEDFHGRPGEILCESIFKEITIPEGNPDGSDLKTSGRFFSETNFLIFQIDVRQVVPVDKDIAELLGENLKQNTSILCQKTKNQAEMQAEYERIESECEIAEMRRALIEIENTNFEKSLLHSAATEAEALVAKAKAEQNVEEGLLRARQDTEIEAMREMIELLDSDTGKLYVDMMRIRSMEKLTKATVLPAGLTTFLMGSSGTTAAHLTGSTSQ